MDGTRMPRLGQSALPAALVIMTGCMPGGVHAADGEIDLPDPGMSYPTDPSIYDELDCWLHSGIHSARATRGDEGPGIGLEMILCTDLDPIPEDTTMSETRDTEAPLHIGDHVGLRGTRIIGDVKQLGPGDDRIVLKVMAVIGVSPSSKMARAWQGAWVTCPPAMVAPLSLH